MRNKQLMSARISMNVMVERDDQDEKYTHEEDYQMNLNRPRLMKDTQAKNVDAAFDDGLVLRQKL